MALPGTFFEYLSAFITIVLALAVTDMLVSLHKLIRARARVRWRVLPLAAAFFILLTLMTLFFEIWRYTRLEGISFYGLLILLLSPLLGFLSAAAVMPDDVPEQGIDLWDHYIAERRYIWGTMFLGFAIDFVFKLPPMLGRSVELYWVAQFVLLNGLAVAASAMMALARDRRLHALGLAILFVLAQYGYAVWEIEAPNAREPAVSAPAAPR